MARTKLPIIALSAVMALSIGYYFLYVEPHQDYLIELDFRRLGAMAERIDMQVTTYRQVVANAVKPPRKLPRPLELFGAWPPETDKPAGEQWVKIDDTWLLSSGRWIGFGAGNLWAGLQVEDLVKPALEPHIFDSLFFATSDGRILYQEGKGKVEIRTLDGLGLDKDVTANLWRSTGLHDVEISGQRYKLFVQPCSTARLPDDASAKPNGWILGALINSSRFHVRAFHISANWIILVAAFALLGMLSLPFLKLLTIGKGERLRAIDGLVAALCALVGLSVMTVLVLDYVVYGRLEDTADEQIQKLAEKIQSSFLSDLDLALEDLAATHAEASRLDRAARSSAGPIRPDRTHFFWADEEGEQILKWTHENQETPLINVRDRAYFRDALKRRLIYLRGKDGGSRAFTLESIRSWTTGEDLLAVATPVALGTATENGTKRHAAVAVLTTRMPSVHQALLPPGFGFAVIETGGRVLFHSDPNRMLQENFLDEAGSPRVRSLVASERRESERIRYMGRQHQVYTAPLSDLGWTIIAFRDVTLLRASPVPHPLQSHLSRLRD